MRFGAAEVAGTARTFLPKRTIHGITEEARRNSVRGFLCDGNGCRRILRVHEAISLSAMSELATARHNLRFDGGFRRACNVGWESVDRRKTEGGPV